MARADLMKKLFQSYQHRDDRRFREVAAAIVEDERKKHHVLLAHELQRILSNNSNGADEACGINSIYDPVPTDADRKTRLITIRSPGRYFEELVLDKRTRESLNQVLAEVRGWDILEAHGLPPTRRVLFCGPSGCGKTSSAEAVAAELALPLLYVRFDSVVSSLLGATAANLRKVFDYASRGNWVIFFDEFDAIGRSRDDATEHGEIKRLVNTFLQLLDGFTGRSLVIAATNFEQALDPAIWRRFDDILRFERPNANDLERLICRRLSSLQYTAAQLQSLVQALMGATYADAERVCFDLRRRCALDGTDLPDGEHLDQALKRYRYRRNVLAHAVKEPIRPVIDRE